MPIGNYVEESKIMGTLYTGILYLYASPMRLTFMI